MLFVSFFGLLMMYSNITDYGSNYEYVAHVLSMDTTQATTCSDRAIISPMLQHRIYWLIITLEVMFTTFCMLGVYQLLKNINSSKARNSMKRRSFRSLAY
jgi:predicted small integral membrane protein